MIQSNTQCVLSTQTVCTVVVGLCVSVGWVALVFNRQWRDSEASCESGALYLHPDF